MYFLNLVGISSQTIICQRWLLFYAFNVFEQSCKQELQKSSHMTPLSQPKFNKTSEGFFLHSQTVPLLKTSR